MLCKSFGSLKLSSRQLSSSIVRHGTIQLRDYQLEAIKCVQTAIDEGNRRPAVVLATGGGKTVVFSHIIPLLKPSSPNRGNKTLVLAHREELVKQAADTIRSINPNLKVDIDMRSSKPSNDADVIVGSVPTLVRMTRLNMYDPSQFKTIILDECHHAAANSWIKILKYFGADTPQSDIYVLGFTATMERNDGKNLGFTFDKIVFERNLMEMVSNKELVDVKFLSVKMDIDLHKVKTKLNDYEVNSLSEVMNTSDNNLILVLSYLQLREKFGFKSTIIFCVDINHCKTLCDVLQRQGINAQYVTGDTIKTERSYIIQDFKDGKIDVLCNVQVFTEGTDIPNIDSLFLARPTKSRSLLVQMIGRGLRHHHSKEFCYIIDIAGTRGTGIQSVPTLFSLPPDYDINEKTYPELVKEKEILDTEEELEREKELVKKEIERQQIARDTHERLTSIQNLKEELIITFNSFDGFLAVESHDVEQYKQNVVVNEVFRNSQLKWLRLEYDIWGLPFTFEDFMLIKRIHTEGKVLFELSLNKFTAASFLRYSGYKCPRMSTKAIIETNENLESVLTKANISFRSLDRGTYKFFSEGNGPLSNKQYEFLLKKLSYRVKYDYKETPQLYETLAEELKKLSRSRAAGLTFALKYSSQSLWVRWELQMLIGPSKKTNNVVEKIFDQQDKPNYSNDNPVYLAAGVNKQTKRAYK
ncbi:P-loop containing nucleoside triphosphate hydrolase protein [Scheffersomyces amazonensis]|uniref:P-loop containing nucleoside triphosphate hydrolase protein n=1 Tax=Scheffersomyces amazonensis TaxID=1078765 RepID=UPI00315C6A16